MELHKPNITRDTSLKNDDYQSNKYQRRQPFGSSDIAFNHISVDDIKLIVQAAVSHHTGCLKFSLLKIAHWKNTEL